MLGSLSSKIDSAAQGNEQAAKSFERVGVSMQDIASLSNEQLLNKVVKSLSGMGDAITRNAIASELFSKAGKNIIWSQLNDELDKGREKYQQYEQAMRDLGDAADKISSLTKDAMGGMALAIGEDFKTMVGYIETFQDKTSVMGRIVRTVFETILVLGSDVVFVISQIAKAVNTLANTSFTSLQKNIDQWKEYNKQAKQSREELDAFQKKILDNTPQAKAEQKDDTTQKRIIETTQKNKDMLRVAEQISQEYTRQQVMQVQQLATRGLMLGMTQDERREQEAVNAVIQSTSQQIETISKQRMDAAGRGATPQVLAEYDKQIAKIYELQDVFISMSREVAKASIETQRTFAFGWNTAFRQYQEDSYNYGKMAQDMFTSITSNMTSALDNFVQTGKINFADFARSIIQDLIKIQLRMQMMQLFSSALGGLGRLGGASAGTHGMSTGTFSGAGFQLPARANGGSVTENSPYMVGERGAELFVPQRSGTIIPNHQLGAALGGGTTINGPYIASMNAIDTQSGIQFLAKNKMTIWSMNQSANRSIPAGK